jgi:hypothetical protein
MLVLIEDHISYLLIQFLELAMYTEDNNFFPEEICISMHNLFAYITSLRTASYRREQS